MRPGLLVDSSHAVLGDPGAEVIGLLHHLTDGINLGSSSGLILSISVPDPEIGNADALLGQGLVIINFLIEIHRGWGLLN